MKISISIEYDTDKTHDEIMEDIKDRIYNDDLTYEKIQQLETE